MTKIKKEAWEVLEFESKEEYLRFLRNEWIKYKFCLDGDK